MDKFYFDIHIMFRLLLLGCVILKSLAIVFRGYIAQIPVIVVDILNWSLICLPIIIIICYLGFNFYNKIQR